MTNRVLQCCYTNASQTVDGKISSGWKAVSVSTDIPSDAYSACVKLQSANSTIQGTMLDETGNVLNLFEIVGDGNYLYVMKSQYGLLDRLGRPNMFSHAFILPCKDVEFISNPNNFLTVSNESFKSSEESASGDNATIVWNNDYDLEQSLKDCQISDQNYAILIQCIYTQYSNKKSAKPLFIQCDGSEQNMMNLLFCIYSAIPLSMRRNLSVASTITGNTVGKNIIFSINAKEKDQYIIPATGENNILTAKMERKISRLVFVDYTAQNHKTLDEPAYFGSLEEKAVELGDNSAGNELILKIAHLLLNEVELCSISDDDLDARISDALRSNSNGSDTMDKYIAALLDEITRRKLYLTDENEESLSYRLENSTESLSVAAEKYNFYRFSMLPTKEAAIKLGKMAKPIFTKYRKILLKSETGTLILDYYYSEVVFMNVELSWDYLEQVLKESEIMSDRPQTLDRVGDEAWKLYSEELSHVLAHESSEVISVYHKYMQIMQSVLRTNQIDECANSAKEEYWALQSFDMISFDRLVEYKEFLMNSDECNLLISYCILPYYARTEGEVAFLRKSNAFFKNYSHKLTDEEREFGIKRLLSYTRNQPITLSKHFEQWGDIFVRVPTPMLFVALLEICRNLKTFDEKKVQESFEKFIELYRNRNCNEKLGKKLAELLVGLLKEKDSIDDPISLDLWLSIATQIYQNCFELFDHYDELEILNVDPVDAIEDCNWTKKRKYVKAAEEYIHNRGVASRVVNRWLKEAKRLNKQSTRPETSESKGIIDKGLSALASLTQADNHLAEAVTHARENGDPPIAPTPQTWKHDTPSGKKDETSSKSSFLKGLFGKK